MNAARCGSFAVHVLGMRGLPLDFDRPLFRMRVESLPTALFSGSDMNVCPSVVRCDIERLVRFAEELTDAELRCIIRTDGAFGVTERDSCACGSVIDSVDAISGRIAALCARLVASRSVKRSREPTSTAVTAVAAVTVCA
jgi:hypothetical protein